MNECEYRMWEYQSYKILQVFEKTFQVIIKALFSEFFVSPSFHLENLLNGVSFFSLKTFRVCPLCLPSLPLLSPELIAI